MTKEKQIEEMAKDINITAYEYCNGQCIGCEHKPKRIEDCTCVDIAIATGLTAKGYRKSSDIAREIFEEIDILIDDWKHSRIQSIQFIAELAELGKKYESEGEEP